MRQVMNNRGSRSWLKKIFGKPKVVSVQPASRSLTPHHPLHGRTFELICRRTAGFARSQARLPIPTLWMYSRLISARRAAFRTVDLLAPCEALDQLADSMEVGDA
jgi:hypothetical protein